MFDSILEAIPAGPFDTSLWWLLLAVILGLLFTLQALEAVVDGNWPHQRRLIEHVPGARGVRPAWATAAVLLIPGALLLIAGFAILLWKDVPGPDGLVLGGGLLLFGWLLFLIFGLNWFGWGRLLGTLGAIGPIAIAFVLLVADLLLFLTVRDLTPPIAEIRDGLTEGLKALLPFL